MSSLALYRKYRPATFDEVLGQEHIVAAIRGALAKGAVSHAYLFSGPRGTGKTTIARIVARELGVEGADLYEIDAASNTSVDDIRALQETVNTLPFVGKYKAYIVDEAHMLSKAAFNAFLKTLEEPPAHVVFMLATTMPHKLPDTVISRCQQFAFRKPSHALLREMVERVGKAEGHAVAPAAADLIALLGDGSFRDTHTILQKVVSGSATDGVVSITDVERVTGAPHHELVEAVVASLATGDTAAGLEAIRAAERESVEMEAFAKLILRTLRHLLLWRFSPLIRKELEGEISPDEAAFLARHADAVGKRITSTTLLAFLDAEERIKEAAIPATPLELALIEQTNRPA